MPNYIDLEQLQSELNNTLTNPLQAEPYLLYIGKLEANKGATLLLDILRQARPAITTLVVGEGSLKGETEEIAGREGLNLKFLGWVESKEVSRLLAGAEALLFPTLWPEPLTRVLQEAIGLVVAMNTGDTPDIIQDGANSLLASTTGELAQKLHEIMKPEQAENHHQLQEALKPTVPWEFSREAVVSQTDSLYRELWIQKDGQPSVIIAHLSRVCYPFHPFGGLEQHVYRLTLELARQGLTVQLLTQPPNSNQPDLWPDRVKHNFVPYHLFKFLRRNSIPDRLVNYPLFSLRLANRVRKLSPAPQLVHAHGLAAFGYALRPRKGVPLVLNPHGMEEFKNKSRLKQLAYTPFRGMLRFAARRAAAVIATDELLIAEVVKYLKVPREKIHLIPNGINLEALDQKLAGAIVPESGFLILSVGRLEENKGFRVGLAALKQIEEKLPAGWRWVIVGEGSQRDRLEGEIAKLGLEQHIQLPGSLPDDYLYGLYRVANLFLHPTLYEGSSLVTLEAMASGLPVVATATGGLPDKIRETGPEENGRLALPDSSASLAAKLAEVLHLTDEARRKLGQNGRKLVEDRFTWQAAGQATLKMYH